MGRGGATTSGAVRSANVEAVCIGARRSNRFHSPNPNGRRRATSPPHRRSLHRGYMRACLFLRSISITWCPYILSYHTKSSKWVPECDSKGFQGGPGGKESKRGSLERTRGGGVSGITDGRSSRVQWPHPPNAESNVPGWGPYKKYVRKNEDNTTVFFFLYEWDLSCDARAHPSLELEI